MQYLSYCCKICPGVWHGSTTPWHARPGLNAATSRIFALSNDAIKFVHTSKYNYAMKMNLNFVAALVLAVFATSTVSAQTSGAAEGRIATTESVHQIATPGGLLLDAGGTRRVIVRMDMQDAHALRVQVANLQEYQANIALVAPDGSIRWEQEMSNRPAFAKMLDLKTLRVEPGTYTLRVQAGAATLTQELVVKTRSVTLGATRHAASLPGSPAMAGK